MAKSSPLNSSRRGLRLALLATSLLIGTPAMAQLTTATIRGTVSTGAAAAPGATVTAVSVDTGFTSRATAADDGSYVLPSLRPGSYDITVTTADGASVVQRVIVSVGQTATLDVDTAAETPPVEEAEAGDGTIVVTGTRLADTRTSEVGTNVSQAQIEDLPQNNRNFLNFAALAPGVRVSNNETRRTFSGGGISADPNGESLGSPQVNVFIDGVSLKSNINQGGIVGQDASRGNPFSQLAVQEFRVLTSNFKAEFEDAGTSIITAITRSGTNDLHGEIFGTYQDQRLIERDFFQRQRNEAKQDLKRYQFGAALGGPIVNDKVFFFGTYEGNLQDRIVSVVPGGSAALRAQVPFDVGQFAGSFTAPFREHLGFGKLNLQIADNQFLEITGSIRQETDLRDFGGDRSRDRATNISNDTYTGRIRHQYDGETFSNEATVDYLLSDLQFGSNAGVEFGRNFQGVIAVGGRPDFQEIKQRGLTFRNNLTYVGLDRHVIKVGAKLSFQKYQIGGSGPFANPEFQFRVDPAQNLNFTIPFEVNFGVGDPNISARTTQVGLFIQDDWEVTPKLTLNLGLRWDYDSNSKNNDYVTPPGAAAALRTLGADPRIGDFFDVEDYISDGSNRKADLDQFQPRVGFSYDFNGDQRTVIFGGYGRYYDRVLFRNAAEESLFRQFRRGNIQFSANGAPRNGQPTIMFNPTFLTPAGFQALLASLNNPGAPGTDELRVIPNDLKSPHTDQFSIGIRQRFGVLRTSLTYNYIIGSDQVGYAPLNRTEATNAGGFLDFIPLTNGFSNAVAGFNTRATRYHGVYVTVDKPYSKSSGWGGGIAYTYSDSKEKGFAFNFDFPNIDARPYVPNAGDETHRLVVNGIVDLPLGIKLSGLATYGSGAPFFVIDATNGFGARDILFPGNVGEIPYFLQIDLRLQKGFRIAGSELILSAEVFNVLDRANFGGADGFTCCGGNANFGVPNSLSGPPRSFQFGARLKF